MELTSYLAPPSHEASEHKMLHWHPTRRTQSENRKRGVREEEENHILILKIEKKQKDDWNSY